VKLVAVHPGRPRVRADFSEPRTTRDYRLFDIQHAVTPTALPLEEFYSELVSTQRVLNQKHFGFRALRDVGWISARLLLRGQTNFIRSLSKFHSVFNPELQIADHAREVRYELRPPPTAGLEDGHAPYIHAPGGRARRTLDLRTENFVNATRMNAA
jgi:hypothetical protein